MVAAGSGDDVRGDEVVQGSGSSISGTTGELLIHVEQAMSIIFFVKNLSW
jgi:hypothetical protein